LLFFNTVLVAQSITWQKSYNSVYNRNDFAEDVCQADSGNFFVVGSVKTYPGNYGLIYLFKIDKYGDTLWTRFVGDSINGGSFGKAITSSGDGGCVITGWQGYYTYAIKYNSNGYVVWEKLFGGAIEQTYDIMKTDDGNFIGCGRKSFDFGLIFKIDSFGNLLWQKQYSAGYSKTFRKVVPAIDNGYVLIGTIRNSQIDTPRGLITKIDTGGNIIWEKNFIEITGTSIFDIDTTNNQYLICGPTDDTNYNSKIFFKRFNINGEEIYNKLFTANDEEFYPQIKSINRNLYLMSIIRDTFTTTLQNYTKIIFTDSVGNILKQKNYFSSDDLEIISLKVIDNNSFMLVGSVDELSTIWADAYLIKTDTTLVAIPIKINSNNINIPDKFSIYNYPNPFNTNTEIHFEIYKNSRIKIVMYDITGKEVQELVNNDLKVGIYETNFNAGNLASGVYFITLYANNIKQITKKIVLLK